ncbi:Cytochrome P450 4V2 [Porites harrisoni]
MILVAAAVSSLFLAAAVLAATFVLLKYHSVAVQRKLPGPKPNFLFGNALQLARLPDELMKQILGFTRQFQKEGLICIWLGPTYPITLLFKPEYAEILLSTSKHMGKSFDYSFLHPWLGTGLLTSDGSKWKTRRRLITPTFHFRILNDFIQVFEEQAAILVKHLEKEANKGVFNIMPYITLCALDVICITSMDASPNAQEDVDSPYVSAVLRVSELIQMRQRSPWLWNDILYSLSPSGREHKRCLKILHDFTNKVIDQRIAERASIKSKTQEEKEKEEVDEDDGLYKRKKRLAFLDLVAGILRHWRHFTGRCQRRSRYVYV